MQYTANQAAELTGKNVATITRAIKSGKLSASKDAAGAWQIDGAELSRVYPLQMQKTQTPDMQSGANPTQKEMQSPDNALREELATLRERVRSQELLLTERQEQIANRQDQITDLREDRDRWRQQATGLLSDLRALKDAIPTQEPEAAQEPEPRTVPEITPNPVDAFRPIPPRPWLWRILKGSRNDNPNRKKPRD